MSALQKSKPRLSLIPRKSSKTTEVSIGLTQPSVDLTIPKISSRVIPKLSIKAVTTLKNAAAAAAAAAATTTPAAVTATPAATATATTTATNTVNTIDTTATASTNLRVGPSKMEIPVRLRVGAEQSLNTMSNANNLNNASYVDITNAEEEDEELEEELNRLNIIRKYDEANLHEDWLRQNAWNSSGHLKIGTTDWTLNNSLEFGDYINKHYSQYRLTRRYQIDCKRREDAQLFGISKIY